MTNQYPADWETHDRNLKPYLWSHRIVSFAGTAISLVLTLCLIFGGGANWLQQAVSNLSPNGYLQFLLFYAGLGLGMKLISTPGSLAHQLIEKKYGLSKQSLGSWCGDWGKGLLVGGVLGAIVLSVVYGTLVWCGTWWWLACGVLLFFFSILLSQLAPILLIPLFYKMKPMDPSPLKERLLKLCEKFSIQVKDVYHLGLGAKTEKGNAAFLGLGRTKRIVIGDTLYEKFPAEQVEAVFAHELGHQINNDVWKGIGVAAIGLFLAVGISQWVTALALAELGLSIRSPHGFYIFLTLFGVVQMPGSVFQAIYSRSREWAADNFAAQKIGLAKPLGDALERLTRQNWGQFRPNALIEFLTYSHPAPAKRILALRR